mgnify:CR=1 FL=1
MVPPADRAYTAPLDRINRAAYRRRGMLRQCSTATGWLEPGEQAAVLSVFDAVRDAPILDLGVGGGRTTPLLRAISQDYCGIDYLADMVAAARRRFPAAQFRIMDARNLRLPDAAFGLATFSYNGIASVDLPDQRLILKEVCRVLRSGGYFIFSTFNRNGMQQMPRWPDWQIFRDAGRHPARLLRAVAKLVVGGINQLRLRSVRRDDGEVAIGNLSAQNFALVALFTTLTTQCRELRKAGFSVEAIFTPDGQRVSADDPIETGAPWHHYVARKPPAGTIAAAR